MWTRWVLDNTFYFFFLGPGKGLPLFSVSGGIVEEQQWLVETEDHPLMPRVLKATCLGRGLLKQHAALLQ